MTNPIHRVVSQGHPKKLDKKAELVKDPGTVVDKVVREGHQLEFAEDGLEGKSTVNVGSLLHRDPATVERSTVVLAVTSDRWPKTELVVKTSWPESTRARPGDGFSEEGERRG